MLRTLLSRRRAEDARVARFVHAIRLSGRYTVDEDWTLQPVPDEEPATTHGAWPCQDSGCPEWHWRTDTVVLPLSLVRLMVPVTR